MEETQNITYEQIDTYVLEKIPWFSEYFYQIYDDSDRELKYEVFWSLTSFFQEHYKAHADVLEDILWILYKIYLTEDKELQELIVVGFIENLLTEDKIEMWKLREALKYKEFQKGLDELYSFWYKGD